MTYQQMEICCLLIMEEGSRNIGILLRKRIKLSKAVIFTGLAKKLSPY